MLPLDLFRSDNLSKESSCLEKHDDRDVTLLYKKTLTEYKQELNEFMVSILSIPSTISRQKIERLPISVERLQRSIILMHMMKSVEV